MHAMLRSPANLWVSQYVNTVKEYVAPYTGAPAATLTNGLNGPGNLVFHTTYTQVIGP